MNKLIKNHYFLTFLAICFATIVGFAQSPVAVSVEADHSDWNYNINEEVIFNVRVTENGKLLKNIKVNYEVGPERMKPTIAKTSVLKGGQLVIKGGTLKQAGFLRCKVKINYKEKEYVGLATAAFNYESIKPTTVTPPDFTQFWERAKAQNALIPIDPQMTLLPERSTKDVNVYEVSIQNYKKRMRVYGILCVPTKPGKYPALLKVPGAGVRPYAGDLNLAQKGVITFQIGIHGIPVTLDPVLYTNLKYGALRGYRTYDLDDKDQYYFKHVYLGCLRAIDFINTLPEYDGQRLGVSGGSQGGALAIVTAALDPRVKFLSSFYPALCDLTGYLNGRAGGWPHLFRKEKSTTKAKIETSKYYDVVSFAKLIKVPGLYSFGFNDETCPPTSVCSAVNSIEAPKEVFIVKETGHFRVDSQKKKQKEFILENLLK